MESNDLREGQQFGSYPELRQFLISYEEREKVVFTTRNSQCYKGSNATTQKNLIYSYIHYGCKFGGAKYRNESTGQRHRSTRKINCPAEIKIQMTKDEKYLTIKSLVLRHVGHENAEIEKLPEIRKLCPEDNKMVVDALNLGCNKKLLQEKLALESNKQVTLKDLMNVQSSLKQKDDNTLKKAVQLLEKKGASVKILHQDNDFKALYFSTSDMRNSMSAWPEIVYIDGTYKLLKSDLTVMILQVEDSNCLGEIVAVALLAQEDRQTFRWFLQCFKDENNLACSKMNCFMGDKDLLERDVLKEIFVNTPVYICLFHTLRTFSRQITTEHMRISRQEKIISLQILQQLAYSGSEEQYQETYATFCESVPLSVVDYFQKNWHPIRNEWTCYSMVHGNLLNRTNNRLEATNSKIKQVVKKNSSLVEFVDRFFTWLYSHNFENDVKLSKSFGRTVNTQYAIDSCEQKYMNTLMEAPCSTVLQEIKSHRLVTIRKRSSVLKECSIKSKEVMLKVTDLTCECPIWTSSFLPCRHIFAFRRSLGLDLFTPELCSRRWTKDYCRETHRIFRSPASPITSSHLPTVVDKIVPQENLTLEQRRKTVHLLLKDIVHLGSLSCGRSFHFRRQSLKMLQDSWKDGFRVTVEKLDIYAANALDDVELEEEMSGLEIQAGARRKQATVPQKRKILLPFANEITENASLSEAYEFDCKVYVLKNIAKLWRSNVEIFLKKDSAFSAKDVQEVPLVEADPPAIPSKDRQPNEKDENITVDDITSPIPIITRGRPSQALLTTPGKLKSKKASKNTANM